MSFITLFLEQATAHGFKQSDTLHALLRRNDGGRRVMNLASDAMEAMPMDVRKRVMEDGFKVTLRLVKEITPDRREPETNPNFVRPGPDGVDPRFWAAGHELQRIAELEGRDAIHKPEHAHLYGQMMRFAPEPLKSEMRAKAEEMGLFPKVTHVGEDGQAVFSAEQLAATHGVPVEAVHQFMEEAGIDSGDLYTGPVHPLQ